MQSLLLPLPEAGKTHVRFPSIDSVLLQFPPFFKHPGYWEGGELEGSTPQKMG